MNLPSCDEDHDIYYDVDVLLPVKLRFWARDAAEAQEQFTDTEITLSGPQITSSVGFPQSIVITKVERANAST